MSAACIVGLEGTTLSKAERAFFRDLDPWGFILFRRNIETPAQVRALTGELRECVGRDDTPILIDQEGGRVQRMGPPHWRRYPTGRAYGRLAANDPLTPREMTRLGARLIAHDLRAVGINVDCVPVLDVPAPDGHEIIGDRAYGEDPDTVAAHGRAAAEGLIAGGVLPIIKHIPGHGRAMADSHLDLPVVEALYEELDARDFAPFRVLSDMPMAMTAHVVYAAVDKKRPATTSRKAIKRVIREAIGFSGLLMSDDLSMKALQGSFEARTRESLKAGCDVVLHCNGEMGEMRAIASACPTLSGKPRRRAEAALARLAKTPEPLDHAEAVARFEAAFALAQPRDRASVTPALQPTLEFEAAEAAAEDGEGLVVDIDGYEGPLHVLLALARAQKVDLRQLSIAKLADQDPAFVHAARRRRFSLAADYLVMAAWLTFLKSRLLLPKPERVGPGEQAVEDIAGVLAARLAKLDQVRRAVDALQARAQLGRDVFTRGDPEAIAIHGARPLEGDLYGLMEAYVGQRRRQATRRYRPGVRVEAYPLEAARARLQEGLAELTAWTPLGALAPDPASEPAGPSRASYLASTLSAGLEMIREGALEASQRDVFAELYLRARIASPALLAAE